MPTLDNADMSFLLHDQPLAPIEDEITMRPKTKTSGGHTEEGDVVGRAEEMTTLGIEGALQRHAMKVDKVYTTLYAPTHIKSVVSMGVSDLDKSVLLPDMALDWRRMRVFREAVFYLTCMVEGHPKKKMAGITVSGQRSGSRKNMMAFTPVSAGYYMGVSNLGHAVAGQQRHGEGMHCHAPGRGGVHVGTEGKMLVRPKCIHARPWGEEALREPHPIEQQDREHTTQAYPTEQQDREHTTQAFSLDGLQGLEESH
ncbi:hypothetical protein SDJN03_00908, partial [Cucurbita argyrosperma subsp. sororia]